MNLYIQEKMRADTAYEMNESNQSTYTDDLIYLFQNLSIFDSWWGVLLFV